jgi:hypothetical protein
MAEENAVGNWPEFWADIFPTLPYAEQVGFMAEKDFLAGCESPSWSPLQLPLPLFQVWAVRSAMGVIDNGNLAYFFENDWTGNPDYARFVGAYRAVGSNESADCLEDAVALLGLKDPHLQYEARRRIIYPPDGESDQAAELIDILGNRMIELDGETHEAIARFVEEHREHFPAAAGFIDELRAGAPHSPMEV